MSYPITTAARQLFASYSRQVARLTIQTRYSGTLNLTEANILTGGLSINRYASSGDTLEIGSAIAAELTLKLDNSHGEYSDIEFAGAQITVQVGTKDWSDPNATLYLMPMGIFTVDESPKIAKEIDIVALDRMVNFDIEVRENSITYPITVGDMITRVCNICNVPLETTVSTLLNYDYEIARSPSLEDLTYRQLIAWCAQITGTCAYMDWNGRLRFAWYELSAQSAVNIPVTPSTRFSSSLGDEEIMFTGVLVRLDENTEYLSGDEGYVLLVEGNELITDDYETIADSLYNAVGSLSFYPFTAVVCPMPHVYPLDFTAYVDAEGFSWNIPITDVTFTLNKNTSLAGKGESSVERGRAQSNPLTGREQVIIQSLKKEQNETLNSRVQSVLAFNELISNALGLYTTSILQEDGSIKYYLHDQRLLENSMTIFTATGSGIAWTTSGWNGGSPVWSSGVTAAGDALFRKLSAEGINVESIGQDYHIEITPSSFSIYYRDMLVTNIIADTQNIPRVEVSEYIDFGKMRLAKHGDIGADFIFLE